MVLIKCCDISNEVRPMEVAEPWVDCLLEEYFMQVGIAESGSILIQAGSIPKSVLFGHGKFWLAVVLYTKG